MKFCDLPIDTRQRLNCERLNLHNRSINSAYEVLLYNQLGTRYFHARRQEGSFEYSKSDWNIENIGLIKVDIQYG